MASYQITHDDQDWGTFEAASAGEALLACMHESDRTRIWGVEHLSNSFEFGKGSGRMNGNGAQDTQNFYYVDGGSDRGVFRAFDTAEYD